MSKRGKPGLTYRDAGVDIDAGNALVERIKPLVARTRRSEQISGLGGFGGLFHLGNRYRDPVLVSGTDGVGTKLMLARRLQRHDTIGIDLVAMCVNDVLVAGAEPLFFLDYFACGKLELDTATAVIRGITDGCQQAGCALIGGETAEMPGMYEPGEYDLAGFSVGAVERDEIIDGRGIRPGACLLGLASSGPHSNGYSLIRKVLETTQARLDDALGDTLIGDARMAPTRIYTKPVAQALQTRLVAGMAHITGGGLTENIIRVVPEQCGIEIDAGAWKQPEVFDWLAREGDIPASEMNRAFNMGIGYVLAVEEDHVASVQAAVSEPMPVIGRVTHHEGRGARVRFLNA